MTTSSSLQRSISRADPPQLDADEIARYQRHLILPGFGSAGQRRLKGSRVLLIGAGGLGSPAALYLAAAGVGHLGIVDFDSVELTNLQRQILHGTSDIGRPKTESARDRLEEINPRIELELHHEQITSANALQLMRGYDLVLDGSDNFQTRYLVNDACVISGIPYVYGAIVRFEGQASVFAAPDGPCYRCLFREPPPAALVPGCAEGGVLGVLPGLIGVIQATEAIKLLAGAGETLVGRLLIVDALRMHFRTIKLRRDPECPACGTREITELADYEAFCGPGSGPRPVGTEAEENERDITPAELAAKMRRGEEFDLIDVREPWEWAIARIEGARLVPLGTLGSSLSTLQPEREIIVQCHHGIRSASAAEALRANGFSRVRNLTGGIARWSAEVDPSVPQY